LDTKLGTLFLFAVLIFGMASFPNSLYSISSDESSLNTSLLTAFADSDEEEDAMENAADAISDAIKEIEKADEKIAKATDEGKDTVLSEETLDKAIMLLAEAEASFNDGNYDEAEDLAEEAEDLASESRGKLIGKIQADFEDDGDENEEEEEREDEEDQDELEFEGIISFIGSNFFTLEGFLVEIFVDDNTEFDEGFDSLNDLMIGFHVDVDVILSSDSHVATEIEVEEELDDDDTKPEKVTLCHNDKNTIKISANAVDAHLNHGDKLGPCDNNVTEFDEEDDSDEEDEIEIKVKVKGDVAKVKVKFDGDKHKFLVTSDTSEDAIATAILNQLPGFTLDESEIMEIWEFEEDEKDEGEPTSHTTTEFDAYEAEQNSQDLYADLQQKINELEERIQALLEKYESGEYYGNVPEVDSEIMSYTISFTGDAISHDDDSVSSVDGIIYIDSLMTNSNTSKYTVTGGEISIDDVFYDFIFGKVRVSPSGNVVLIGQVMNWADEDDDSSTIKLIIQSDVPLEGGFGLESLNIEILPQSKIAGQWYLSGSGTIS